MKARVAVGVFLAFLPVLAFAQSSTAQQLLQALLPPNAVTPQVSAPITATVVAPPAQASIATPSASKATLLKSLYAELAAHLDRLHRQRRRHRLQSIQRRYTSRYRNHQFLLRHWPLRIHAIHLHGKCIRRRRQQLGTVNKRECNVASGIERRHACRHLPHLWHHLDGPFRLELLQQHDRSHRRRCRWSVIPKPKGPRCIRSRRRRRIFRDIQSVVDAGRRY
jgi:hypothetical protein